MMEESAPENGQVSDGIPSASQEVASATSSAFDAAGLDPAAAFEGQALLPLVPVEVPRSVEPAEPRESLWRRAAREVVAGVQTLLSAAVYATLIVTFGFQ